MRRRRTIGRILVFVSIAVLLMIAGGFWLLQKNAAQPVVEPTPTPIAMDLIFVASQDIRAGSAITESMVEPWSWPRDVVPVGAMYDPTLIYGKIARTAIQRGQVIVPSLLANADELWSTGSLAASMLENGEVAIAYPITALSSVAYGLKSGDFVDLILNLYLTELDTDFQSKLPNDFMILTQDPETQEYQFMPMGTLGRLEDNSELGVPIFVLPGEGQRPRLVTQLSIKSARVLRLGSWLQAAQPTSTPQAPNAEETPLPEPTQAWTPPDVITVAVKPQDAITLQFLIAMGAHTTFAVHSEGQDTQFNTEPVTLDFILQNFGIPIPSKLPYNIVPPPVNEPLPTEIPPTPDDVGAPTPVP